MNMDMEQQAQTKDNPPLELNKFLTLDLPQKESYWGEGLVDPQSIIIIGGGSKIGKTIFALNLGLRLAQGRPFLDFPITSPTKVLLIQQEVRDASIQKRLKIMLTGITVPPDNFYYKGMCALKIDTPEGVATLRKWVSDIKPQVLILDPLYKLHNRDENSSREMLLVIDEIDRLRRDYGLAVIIVHHHTKQAKKQAGARQLRGSSVLFDYGDSYLSLSPIGKNRGAVWLNFELRNAESPPLMQIKKNLNLWYEVKSIVGQKKNFSMDTIVETLRGLGGRGIAQNKLVEAVIKAHGASEATIRREIQKAIKAKCIAKQQAGKHSPAYLSLP